MEKIDKEEKLENILKWFEKDYPRMRKFFNLMGFELIKENDVINLYSLDGKFIATFDEEKAINSNNIYFAKDYDQLSFGVYSRINGEFLINEINFSKYIPEVGFLNLSICTEKFKGSKKFEKIKIKINSPHLEVEDIEMVIFNDNSLIIRVDKTGFLSKMRTIDYSIMLKDENGLYLMAMEVFNPGRFISLFKESSDLYKLNVGKLGKSFSEGELVKKYSKNFSSKEEAEIFIQRFMSSQRIKKLYEYVMNGMESTIPGITDSIFSDYEIFNNVKKLVEQDLDLDNDIEFEKVLKYFRLKSLDFKSEKNIRGLRKRN